MRTGGIFILDKKKGPEGPLSWEFEIEGQLTSCQTRVSRKSEGKGPGKDFFAIRPVRLSRTPEGLVATPITGGPHPDLLKLDEADGYLEMHPFAYRDLEPGDEVTVELRYPYTQL